MINNMTKRFGSKMTSLVTVINKFLRRRDDIYFKKIDEHAEAVKKMQETNSSIKLLTNKVFGLSSSIHQFKEFARDASPEQIVLWLWYMTSVKTQIRNMKN